MRDRDTLARLQRQSARAVTAAMETRRTRLDGAAKLLSAFSYHSVLNRGFALVRDANGQPVRSVASTSDGMGIETNFRDIQNRIYDILESKIAPMLDDEDRRAGDGVRSKDGIAAFLSLARRFNFNTEEWERKLAAL